jgi:carboxyl-terminal processing protease
VKTPLKLTIGAAVALMIMALAFAGGVVYERLAADRLTLTPPVTSPTTPEQAAREVVGIIQEEALDPSNDASLTAGVVQGLLDALEDPYANYFDAKHFEYFDEQTRGEFFGIGITISDRDGKPYVVSVIPGTPAEAAGLKANDVIASIDGVERDKWDLDEVVKRVRGPEGTTVKLEIAREGQKERLTFTITRAKIDVPTLEQELVGTDVGYIRLYTFNGKSVGDVRDAIAALTKAGAKGFVLDLRDNPGGLLDSSVDMLSLFVKDGVAVRVEARDPRMNAEYRVSGKTATDAPLVVLVNENSASASEIVAGGLQDYARATIVGVTSFGKGSVQQIEELSFGGAIKLTIAHYLTPKGRIIDKKGVVPDVEVPMEAEKQAERETDVQFERAVRKLRDLL